MMRRENSFLKQKQEQWAREKAEHETTPEWFPFGENLKPGGGSPLRKYLPKTGKVSPAKCEETHKKIEEKEMHKTPEKIVPNSNDISPKNGEDTPHPPPPPPSVYPYLIPAYTLPYPYQQSSQMQNEEGNWPTNFQYHIVPPNAIPVSTINLDQMEHLSAAMQRMWAVMPHAPPGMRIGIPIPPPPTSATPMDGAPPPPPPSCPLDQRHHSMTSSMSSIESSTIGRSCPVSAAPPPTHHEHSMSEASSSSSSSSSSSDGMAPTYDYAAQIEERRQAERDAAAREAVEAQRAAREQAEIERRRAAEEEFRRAAESARVAEERRRSEQFAEAMERARKEAELLKKARLYRHVLENADEQEERRLLGDVDEKTGQRLRKEVSEVERQKRQDEAEIQRNAPPKKLRVDQNESSTQRARSSSISSKQSPIARNGFGRRSVRTTSREKTERQNEMLKAESALANRNTVDDSRRDPNSNIDESMYYCPIDRSYSFSQEIDDVKLKNYSPKSSKKRSNGERGNSITQTALFGPIPTRRCSGMRVPSLQSSPVGQNTVMGSLRGNSFDGDEEEEEMGGSVSVSPDLKFESPLPSSTENVHPKIAISPSDELHEKEHKAHRVRSALGSPSSYLNGGGSLMGSRCGSPMSAKNRFLQKLEEKGTVTREEDFTSENIRRLTEANRTPSSLSLCGSMQNLAIRGSMVNLSSNGEPSPKLSKFRSMNSPARQSLTRLSKTSDKQLAVLDRLSRLRETLAHSKVCTSSSMSNINKPPLSPNNLL